MPQFELMSFLIMMHFEITVLLLMLVRVPWTESALTASERQEFVDIHNFLRRSVVPEASDMQEMVYNTTIEGKVYDYLDLCKFEHRKLDGYGENGRLATDGNITNTVFSWFQERVYFDITLPYDDPKRCAKENSAIDYLGQVQCGHYITMAKSTLVSLGCGVKLCNKVTVGTETITDNYITFCFYNSGQQNPPYEVGKTCSSCNIGYEFCYNEMCVKKKTYNRTLIECRTKCNNCAPMMNFPIDCLCECPDNTRSGACIGKPKVLESGCSPCQQISRSCAHGGKEVNTAPSATCACTCKDEYQGQYCEVRKVEYSNSHEFALNGLPWRYNMSFPANILQFKISYKDFQKTISGDVNELCANKDKSLPADIELKCKELAGSTISPDDVVLIPGYPILNKNGSLMIRMSINYSSVVGGSKTEAFVSPLVIAQVWRKPSNVLNDLIQNVRQMNPIVFGPTTTTSSAVITAGQISTSYISSQGTSTVSQNISRTSTDQSITADQISTSYISSQEISTVSQNMSKTSTDQSSTVPSAKSSTTLPAENQTTIFTSTPTRTVQISTSYISSQETTTVSQNISSTSTDQSITAGQISTSYISSQEISTVSQNMSKTSTDQSTTVPSAKSSTTLPENQPSIFTSTPSRSTTKWSSSLQGRKLLYITVATILTMAYTIL